MHRWKVWVRGREARIWQSNIYEVRLQVPRHTWSITRARLATLWPNDYSHFLHFAQTRLKFHPMPYLVRSRAALDVHEHGINARIYLKRRRLSYSITHIMWKAQIDRPVVLTIATLWTCQQWVSCYMNKLNIFYCFTIKSVILSNKTPIIPNTSRDVLELSPPNELFRKSLLKR